MNTALKTDISNDIRRVVLPSTESVLTPPRLFQHVVKPTELPSTIRSNEVVFYKTKNARAWFDGVSAIFLNEDMDTLYKYGDIDANVAVDSEPTYLQGNTLFLGAAGANNYYHWMVDVIPRLKVLELAGIYIDSIDNFVLRDLDWSFQETMLEILGIPKSKLHLVAKKPGIICDNLYHIELRNFVGMKMHPFIPDYLRELFLKNKQPSTAKRKLFINRPSDEKRPVDNEQEVFDLVSRHGYEVLNVRGLDFYEQAELFQSASSIITPHGAVLANLVYCDPGTKVTELFGSHVFSYFYGLSNLCKLDYTAIVRSPDHYSLVVDPNVGNQKNDQQTTIKQASPLNIEALEKALSDS